MAAAPFGIGVQGAHMQQTANAQGLAGVDNALWQGFMDGIESRPGVARLIENAHQIDDRLGLTQHRLE